MHTRIDDYSQANNIQLLFKIMATFTHTKQNAYTDLLYRHNVRAQQWSGALDNELQALYASLQLF